MQVRSGVSLRTKLLTITIIVFLLLAAGTAVSLYQERQVMQFVDKTNTYVTWMMTTFADTDQEAAALYRQYYEDSQRAHRAAWTFAIGMLAVSFVISLLLGVYFVRRVTRPLNRFVDAMTAVSRGDLTVVVAIETKDEIGRAGIALNDLVRSLNNDLSNVMKAAVTVNNGSKDLNGAADLVSDTMQQQASAVEETAAALAEMTGAMKRNAGNAAEASRVAKAFGDAADKGVHIVGEIVQSMQDIRESSTQIATIINVIDGIAFQTNLLALNAAVEAARAGEHGRGFSVVAAEVRTLSQRAAQAAKEIKALVSASGAKVESGNELINRSGRSLEEMAASVKQIADLISAMSVANQEQAEGMDQVSHAIEQIESGTQAGASQAEELTATSESLAQQAAHLKSLVDKFKLNTEARTQLHDRAGATSVKTRAVETSPLVASAAL